MGRKLRLDYRKSKSERPSSSRDKKLPLLVSFPLSRVYSKLTVSLPRTIFLHGEVNALSVLKQKWGYSIRQSICNISNSNRKTAM